MKPILFTAALAATVSSATAQLENLWVTEVFPDGGQVELTNVGSSEIDTGPSTLPLCHGFRYGDVVPANRVISPGESIVIENVNFASPGNSDLWIYRRGPGGFGSAANILNGLQWGPVAPRGRGNVAEAAGIWDSADTVVPAPGPGQSLLLVGDDPFSAENWAAGEPDIGSFQQPAPPEVVAIELELGEDTATLTWTGGFSPFQVETSTDLSSWTPVGDPTFGRSVTVPRSGEGNAFYRVSGGAALAETAVFSVEVSNFFSSLFFDDAPPQARFSPLVGGTHDASTTFWEEGGSASAGLAQVVMDGSPALFGTEVAAAIAGGGAGSIVSAPGPVPTLTTLEFELAAGSAHPLLTLVSWVAPAGDLFTGVQSLSLLGEGGDWVESLEVELKQYDAGLSPTGVISRAGTPAGDGPGDTIGALVLTRLR